MENEKLNKSTTIFIIVIIVIIFFWVRDNKKLEDRIELLKTENNELQREIEDYSTALWEANDNIDKANAIIEDARYTAWESYDEMGLALENLTTVENVDEP